MKEIIDALKRITQEEMSNRNTIPFTFLDEDIRISIQKEQFHEIEMIKNVRQRAFFIDGGNAEIFSSMTISLHCMRVCAVLFENEKMLSLDVRTFFVLIKKEAEEYVCSFFPEKGDLLFSDEECRFSTKTYEMSVIGDTVRRFAEIRFATCMLKTAEDVDVLLLDGTLQATSDKEKMLLDALYSESERKKYIVGSIAKTTTLTTKQGIPPSKLLHVLTPEKTWFYTAVDRTLPFHQARVYFAKLHPTTTYVFRTELYQNMKAHASSFFSTLSFYAQDPVFLGYPYGMIVADKFARVSREEARLRRTEFIASCGALWETMGLQENCQNAHTILDTIL